MQRGQGGGVDADEEFGTSIEVCRHKQDGGLPTDRLAVKTAVAWTFIV
jgi:hypothetical protein